MTKKIMAFGEVMMRLEAEKYKKIEQVNQLNISFTGTGVNVLSSLSRFGNQTYLLSKLPGNSIGEAALAHIRSLGISTKYMRTGGDYLGMYFFEHGFGARSSNVTYSNRLESSFCQSALDDYHLEESLNTMDVIHLCGINLAISNDTRDLTLQVAKQAKEKGIKVALDFNYRPKLWEGCKDAKFYYEQVLAYCDICFMTERDAMGILGIKTNKENKQLRIQDTLQKVAETYDVQWVAGTIRQEVRRDEHLLSGFLVNKDRSYFSKQYQCPVLERIGGGDGFSSGIIHGLISDYDIEDTLEFATAAGVAAHSTEGDSPISSLEDITNIVSGVTTEINR